MTTKAETQYQHLEPRPARITGSCSSRVDEFERRWFTKPSMALIPAARKNLHGSIRFPSRRSSRLSTMWPRISRSLSKSGTARRPGSARGASSGQRRNEVAARREHEQPRLASRLRAQGHDPILAPDVGLLSVSDPRVLILLHRREHPCFDSRFG